MINDDVANKKIKEILIHNKRLFLTSKKIYLKNDSKKYRVPDFYLPEYKLIIEFFSSWDVPKNVVFQKHERARFMEKVTSYGDNGYNCLFIYPNEIDSLEKLIMGSIKKIEDYNKFKNKPKPLMWILPWMYQIKIEKPLESNFSKKPLDWDIPWLKQKLIDAPLESDFKEKPKHELIFDDPEPIFKKEPEIVHKEELFLPILGVIILLAIIIFIILLIFVFLSV